MINIKKKNQRSIIAYKMNSYSITINLKMFNALLQLLSYFSKAKSPITITLAITVDYYNIFKKKKTTIDTVNYFIRKQEESSLCM